MGAEVRSQDFKLLTLPLTLRQLELADSPALLDIAGNEMRHKNSFSLVTFELTILSVMAKHLLVLLTVTCH